MRNPNEIVADALIAIHASPDLPALEQVKAGYLGKSGQLTETQIRSAILKVRSYDSQYKG